MEDTLIPTEVSLFSQLGINEAELSKKEIERRLIKSMAGSFRVSFKFAETFAASRTYNYHDRKLENAKEYTCIIEETDDKIVIQHLLYMGPNAILKHWRQDWIYENRDFLVYAKDNAWTKKRLDAEAVKGTWTQKVYQVDDSPRYEGFGTWVHVDGRHFWESKTDSPLPRRELSKRDDYNVLRRRSHIEIFDNGDWLLDQDNDKIIRNEKGEDEFLCQEKGLEKFTRQSYDPVVATDWWQANAHFWADVRALWDEVIMNLDFIKVNVEVNKIQIYMALFELNEKFAKAETYNSKNAIPEIRGIFANHVEGYTV